MIAKDDHRAIYGTHGTSENAPNHEGLASEKWVVEQDQAQQRKIEVATENRVARVDVTTVIAYMLGWHLHMSWKAHKGTTGIVPRSSNDR
jgi:hypothetical protein